MLELHVLVAVVKQPLVDYLWSNYGPYMTALESRSPQLFMAGRPALDAAAAARRLLIRDRFHQRQFETYLQSLVRHCPGATTTRDLVDWVLLSAAEHDALRSAGQLDMNGRLNELVHKQCLEEFVNLLGRLGWLLGASDAAETAPTRQASAASEVGNATTAVWTDIDDVDVDVDIEANAFDRKRGGMAAPERRRRRVRPPV